MNDPARGMAALERERQAPVGLAVELDPAPRSSATTPGASAASASTAERRHEPRPAVIVSSACSSGESSSPIAAASPPCAQKLELSASGLREMR